MSERRDVMTWATDWLKVNAPTITEGQLLRFQIDWCREFGGSRTYNAKSSPMIDRHYASQLENRAILAVLASDKPMDQIAQHIGISRASLYRLIKRRDGFA